MSSALSHTTSTDSENEDDDVGAVGPKPETPERTLHQQQRNLDCDLLTIKSLSLQSPIRPKPRAQPDYPMSPPALPPHHTRNSSFSLYSSSSPSGGSANNRTGGGGISLAGSVGSAIASRTPCSSAKSSPRQVPLTVLTSTSFGPSPSRTAGGRPPVHGGMASLLYSLDGKVDDEDLLTPRRLEPSLDCADFDEPMSTPSHKRSIHPAHQQEPMMSTPSRKIQPGSSPRTPLPKITLTPKTPLSARRSQRGAFPQFPSPADDGIDISTTPLGQRDHMGYMMDSLLGEFPERTPTSRTPTSRDSTRNGVPLSLTFNPDSSHSLTLSLDGKEDAGKIQPFPSRRGSCQSLLSDAPPMMDDSREKERTSVPRKTFLPLPDFCGSPPEAVRIVHARTPQRTNRSVGRDHPMGIQTKSLLAPSLSNGILDEMMRVEAIGGVADAENGSLSDSDEEEFLLATPDVISSERDDSPAGGDKNRRQRRRRSYEKIHRTTNRPTIATQPSNTSLLGMDIVQEESTSISSSNRASTPYSSLPSSSKLKVSVSGSTISHSDGEGGENSLVRGKSEQSLGSLGLCLDLSTSGDGGRDLVTPPTTMASALSPPALLMANYEPRKAPDHMPTFCVSAADKQSVTLAIVRMASEDHELLQTPS